MCKIYLGIFNIVLHHFNNKSYSWNQIFDDYVLRWDWLPPENMLSLITLLKHCVPHFFLKFESINFSNKISDFTVDILAFSNQVWFEWESIACHKHFVYDCIKCLFISFSKMPLPQSFGMVAYSRGYSFIFRKISLCEQVADDFFSWSDFEKITKKSDFLKDHFINFRKEKKYS